MMLFNKIVAYLSLDGEVDNFDRIHESIERDILFKGTNLWILIFAIIIASVGLNMNSTAVIIGAMLISPLMGPINGIGYSIATYNLPLFRLSIKNFSFAVIASLAASTLYFSISPISTAHSELLARTSPTIYDVLIALFGGLAGIIAISSKQKGNVIPGVAIATALMPPLCTAGYGLATGQYPFFLGAIYLFTINTVFIALSAVIISQLLDFPIRMELPPVQKKRINQAISVVTTLVLVPSFFFGYKMVEKEKFNDNAARFIRSVSILENNYLLKSETDASKKQITLVYAGTELTENIQQFVRRQAEEFSLNGATLHFRQGLSLDAPREEQTALQLKMQQLVSDLNAKNKLIDSLTMRHELGKPLKSELQAFYPQVTGLSYSKAYYYSDTSKVPLFTDIVTLTVSRPYLKPKEKQAIRSWLGERLNSDRMVVFFEDL